MKRTAHGTAPHRRDRQSTSLSTWTAAPVEVATGLPFFDHMLHQLGRHGGLRLA